MTARLVAAERHAAANSATGINDSAATFGSPCHASMLSVIGATAYRPAPTRPAVARQRAPQDEDREDREHGEHPDAVEERRRRDVRQRQEGAVDGRDARVEREPVSAQHPVRVVDQERLLALDLLGVEQVLAPVLAGKRVPPITSACSATPRPVIPASPSSAGNAPDGARRVARRRRTGNR